MADVLRAMSISGTIMIAVAVLVVFVSIPAVKRGETAMQGVFDTRAWWNTGAAEHATIPAAGAKVAAQEISVIQILIFGSLLFGIAVLFLLGISIVGQL